jgi:3-phosphoshikimate 1-carboxyvinyltransferase
MDIRLNGILSGAVMPPPSKSQAHRLLICAALATEPCTIVCSALNDDIVATMNCLNALGADIKYSDGVFTVLPVKLQKGATLNCGESGSTLRFLLSVAAALGADATFVGAGKLPQRPNGALCDALALHGIEFEKQTPDAELPLTCRGSLAAGNYRLPGNISSQYLTGLLFALPLLEQESTIEITDGLTSASYVDMTIDAVRRAGITISNKGNIYEIKGRQQYHLPQRTVVEGDWSAAAFWLVAGVIGKHPITVQGINYDSLQGDRCIVDHLRKMGAFIEIADNRVVAFPSQLFGTDLDCMDTPDLVPILAVAAAAASGSTEFYNVGRLRYKESDRLAAMQKTLSAFGIASSVGEDTFTVYGGTLVAKSAIDSFGDHRIAMSAAILSTIADGETTILGAECVAKSYPSFYDHFLMLGGNVNR